VASVTDLEQNSELQNPYAAQRNTVSRLTRCRPTDPADARLTDTILEPRVAERRRRLA